MKGERPYCPVHDLHDDPDVDRSWHVYYCYAADGTCLYVGLAEDVIGRLSLHGHYSSPSQSWFHYVASVEVGAAIPCRIDAHALEVGEIQRLRPACNRHHNPQPTPWTRPESRVLTYGQLPPVTWLDLLPTEQSA